jgi:predicted Zn-ribbon and HTH transcriptional regulator
VVLRQPANKNGITLAMTFKPTGTVILDLTVTCTACGYRIQPNEVVLVAPQSVRCPKCQQDFSPSHSKVA